MASLRQIKRRIRSVSSTKQITKAMQMVAASRLKRAEDKLMSLRPYAYEMEALVKRLRCVTGGAQGPFFARREIKNTALVLFVGDKGLCGSYNTNIFKKSDEFLKNYNKGALTIILIGRKGVAYLGKKEFAFRSDFLELGNRIDVERAKRLASFLSNSFAQEEFDEVYIQYAKYGSMVSYKITLEKLFPIEKENLHGDEISPEAGYIYEPNKERIFEELIPHYIETKLTLAISEAVTSEQAARMVAMKQATDNADEMIQHLTLVRNKVRQASITKEIIEITSGAEAIK